MVRTRSIIEAVNNGDSWSALRRRSITSIIMRIARSALERASAGTVGRQGGSMRRRERLLRTEGRCRAGGESVIAAGSHVCTAPELSGGSNGAARERKQ